MLCLKNHLWALVAILVNLSLLAQNIPTIQVDLIDPTKLSPVARQVVEARNQLGDFEQFRPLRLTSENYTKYRGLESDKIRVLRTEGLDLTKILNSSPDFISLDLPIDERISVKLDLIKVNLLADGFNIYTSEDNKKALDYKKPAFYRGIVRGQEENSIASISVFENQIIGSFNMGDGNIVIQPDFQTEGILLLYNDQDFTEEFPFQCLTDQLAPVKKEISPRGVQNAGDCVRVYIECDYALYQNKGSTSNTSNWITSVYNNVATLYANESINTAISEIFIWTTADSYSKTNSVTALNQFKTLRPTFNGDLAHLAALGGNNIGGVAWLDVLCSSYKYAYSNISSTYSNVPTYSWTVEVMTHEMGHNLGSNHTQWCGWTGGALDNCYTTEGGCPKGPAPTNGGTIMSYCHLTNYGINFNNGFGTQPGDKIRAEVAAATCLGNSCGGGSCNTPTGLQVTNITQNSATGSWNSVTGATSYKFEYKTNSSNTWTVITTSSTSYNMTGLSSSTLYNTRVKAVCTSGESTYSATVNFTTSNGGSSCEPPTGLAASNITETTATISWSPASGAVSYNFQYKLSSSNTWSQVNVGLATVVNMSGMSPGTSYDVRVQTVCSGSSSAFTSTLTFTTLSAGYCASAGSNATYEWVKRVNIGSIDRTSASDGGYYNGTGMSTDVNKGSTYALKYQAGTTGNSGNLYWRVWIDYNNNQVFEDPAERVVSKKSSSTNLLTSNITIPTSAATASVRMRVSMKYGGYSTPCLTFPYGEVEDYTINILASGSLKGTEGSLIPEISDLNIYPNPFGQQMNLSFFSNINQDIQISLLDPLGRIISDQNLTIEEGANHLMLPAEDLKPSHYIVRVKSGSQFHYKKMIKLE